MAVGQQLGVTAGFGLVQCGNEVIKICRSLEIALVGLNIMFNPLLAARYCQQLAVERDIPLPVQAKLAKRSIEGQPVAVAFRVGKGAVHIE